MIVAKRWTSAALILLFTAAAAAQSSAPATQNNDDLRNWFVDFPDKAVTVNISYPAGWDTKKDAAGKPTVSRASKSVVPPTWTFDIKTDPQARPLEQVLEQFVTALKASQHTIVDSQIVDLPGGKKAAMVVSTSSIAGNPVTTRNTLLPLDKGQLLVTEETTLTADWPDIGPTFERMSKALSVQPLK